MRLPTATHALTLARLTRQDAGQLLRLMQANSGHLTAYGDFRDEIRASGEELAEELIANPDRHWRFGIFLGNELIGRVDLLGIEPPNYGLGYWLSENHTGKGYATESVRAVIGFASSVCRARDIYAGVTHGNAPSAALLSRLGFHPSTRFDTYTRYHLAIN